MKPFLAQFLHDFTEDQILAVYYCWDEMNALRLQYFYLDPAEIESNVNSYCDEIYETCRQDAIDNNLLTKEQFDWLYLQIEDICEND